MEDNNFLNSDNQDEPPDQGDLYSGNEHPEISGKYSLRKKQAVTGDKTSG